MSRSSVTSLVNIYETEALTSHRAYRYYTTGASSRLLVVDPERGVQQPASCAPQGTPAASGPTPQPVPPTINGSYGTAAAVRHFYSTYEASTMPHLYF